MKSVILIFFVVIAGLLKRTYHSAELPSPDPVFVSCTECPKDIRGFLAIPADADCDMIKWKLQLLDNGNYVINTEWGYHINNRTWEKRGELLDSRGTWKVSRSNPGFTKSEIYVLATNDRPGESLPLLKLNDNMFQIMTKDKRMLPGGEGFTNMLNRTHPVADKSIDFTLADTDVKMKDMTLSGRTPLAPFEKELAITDKDREKIKWKIDFHADGTLDARRILEKAADCKGRWTMVKGWSDNPDAVVYKLELDAANQPTLYLLKGSDDVYFFLSKDGGLVNGNHLFGSALIRRPPSGR